MPLQYQQLVLRDFDGGITDNYINADPNRYKSADNFIIDDNGLRLRGGNKVVYQAEAIQRIKGLFRLNEDMFVQRIASFFRFNNGALENIAPPNVGSFFPYANDDSYPSAAEWRDQLHVAGTGIGTDYNAPMRVWKDDTNTWRTVELGLDNFDGSTIVNAPTLVEEDTELNAQRYLYRLIYEYEYKVGDTTFLNVSSFHQFAQDIPAMNKRIGQGTVVNISGFPDLNNPRIDYDNVKIGIYRTDDSINGGGTTFGKVGEVEATAALRAISGNTVFIDNTPDTEILNGFVPLLYTQDGSVEHFKVPKCKHMFIVNNTAYYLNVIEELESGDVIRPYRFVQSIPNAPSATDPTFFEDVDDVIIGGSHINNFPLIFTKSYIYRIEGVISASGDGSIRKRVISDTIGCVSHRGIVRTGQGVYFAGLHGFYVTDGYQYRLLTEENDDSYAEIVGSGEKIVGTYDEKNELIIWACGESGSSENNVAWVLNLKSGRFTKLRGLSIVFNTILYRNDVIFRGDEAGYIYEHNDEETSDVRRDLTEPVDNWESQRIPFLFESVAVDFGNPHVRKWGQEFTLSLKSDVPAAVTLTCNDEDGEKVKTMKEMVFQGSWVWRDDNFFWRDPQFVWRLAETQVKQRRFPRSSARFRRRQIRIEPAVTTLYKSDDIATCTLAEDPSDSSRTLATIEDGKWPKNILEDNIFFEVNTMDPATDDDYQIAYLIVERLSDTEIIIAGQLGITYAGTGRKWLIRGYRRSQRMEIKAMSFKAAPLDNVGGEYKTSESGENA